MRSRGKEKRERGKGETERGARGARSGFQGAGAARTGAHANDDKRPRLLRAVLVALRVTQLAHANGGGLLDLILGARADEDRLATPLDDHTVALGQVPYVHLERGEGHDVGRGVERGKDLDHQEAAGRGAEEARAACERRCKGMARKA